MARVKAPSPDPNVGLATMQQAEIARMSELRAGENDRYFREMFAPRYLEQMDEQIRMGRELTDFSMGLARRNQDRLEGTTWRYQDQFNKDVDAYNTEDNREQMAGQAMADIQRNMDAGTGQMRRGMAARGVNPNSGMSMMMERRNAVDGALAKAQAGTVVRDAALKEGLNLKAMAAGMGGNLGGAAQGWASMVPGAASMGMAGIQGAQQGFGAANSAWNQSMGMAGNAWQSVGNFGLANQQMAYDAARANAMGTNQVLGTAMGWGLGKWGR